MIHSITLQNFKSFGEKQTVKLEPITVLVGPNNSGKSSFMSVGRFVANLVVGGGHEAIEQEGGESFFFHRPPAGDGSFVLAWESDQSNYFIQLSKTGSEIITSKETLSIPNKHLIDFYQVYEQNSEIHHSRLTINGIKFGHGKEIAPGLSYLVRHHGSNYSKSCLTISQSRMVKLSLRMLREDSAVVPEPRLGMDGAGMAAVLGLWRGSQPEKVAELESFLHKCLPEVRNVLVRPAPAPGYQRLWVRQSDGEEFDAEHLSDGVLCFIALTMQAIDAGPGQLLFIEEPEHSIHPRRLREMVDLLKELVAAKGCQFVIATHSPVLLNAFRDEPESIVLFRRTEKGTRVKRLDEIPTLREALQSAPPGEMLESGFFNQDF